MALFELIHAFKVIRSLRAHFVTGHILCSVHISVTGAGTHRTVLFRPVVRRVRDATLVRVAKLFAQTGDARQLVRDFCFQSV
jgi:hypothetical protein